MMRVLRAVAGVVLGYVIVAGALSLLVMTWWINEWLPVSLSWIVAIMIALMLAGWLAGTLARIVAGDFARVSVYVLAALTALVMTINIILDVAAEPLWFKALVLALTLPSILISGLRGGSGFARHRPDDAKG